MSKSKIGLFLKDIKRDAPIITGERIITKKEFKNVFYK